MNTLSKIILIDKPNGWTSFDVVAKIRSYFRKETGNKKIKVGHAGTLDPFATGLLIVLVGEATKEQDLYMKKDKEYETTLRLGFVSTTGDPEGKISETPNAKYEIPNEDQISKVLKSFMGEIDQVPPQFSAIKINGKKAYELARAGKEVEIKPRRVSIHELDLVSYNWPELKIKTKVSSGTYIRTLGEDIGQALGTGAYLTQLRRTKIGEFDIKDAKTITETIDSNQPNSST